ncbi:conserved hypothetical protein [Alteromonas sp. 38]|uniref:DUF2589 domain-containing protein n=1 Tax=unclassified Alteromonas TaxID=2614992 RepID=UPI0012EFDE51|nr:MULTISPECIES: DUF2589 domain-containing protein [unclassified Alteromonas]CAD5275222.1 conserved hypothetical protein [Alteromonas sp. 154]VXB64274.1 conserved hypothetical protein [Alteromonas sp. 38]
MNNSTEKTVMSNLFTFEKLVEFPLTSIIESSANGNNTTLNFLNEYCFTNKNGKREAVKFIFYYDYVKGGAAQTMRVEIPIISLITMPYYTINSAQFEMGINILSWVDVSSETWEQTDEGTSDKKLLAMLGPYESSSPKGPPRSAETAQYSKVNTNMKVKMDVVSSDLPSGILQLLNVSSQGVEGHVAYDLKISPNTSRLLMDKEAVQLTLTLMKNNDEFNDSLAESDDIDLVPLTVTLIPNDKVELEKAFGKYITVDSGDIVGSSSIEQVQVLTNTSGEIKVTFHPTLNEAANGFINVSSPLTSTIKIYFRIINHD